MSRFFTARAGGVEPGVALHSKAAGTVRLGEAGRSRRAVDITVDPAVVVGSGWESVVVAGALIAKGGAVRIEAGPEGTAIAVRARTDVVYTRGCPGRIEQSPVAPWATVAEGVTAWGDAGGLGTHPDALLVADRPACAVVVFSGGRGKGQGARLLLALERDGRLRPVLVDLDENAQPELRPSAVLTAAEIVWAASVAPEKAAAALTAATAAPVRSW